MVIVTHAFAAEQTWTGATSDKMCGADYKKWRATNRSRLHAGVRQGRHAVKPRLRRQVVTVNEPGCRAADTHWPHGEPDRRIERRHDSCVENRDADTAGAASSCRRRGRRQDQRQFGDFSRVLSVPVRRSLRSREQTVYACAAR